MTGRTKTSTRRPPRPVLGLTWRLFAAVGLVVIAGATTMMVAVLLIAEPAFHAHLTEVQPPMSEPAHAHVDRAFASAVLIALAVGVVIALAVALFVTWLVARRLAARSLKLPGPRTGSPTATTGPGFGNPVSGPSSTS